MSPKRTATVDSLMRPFRRDRRGLAEIVGTLMLVVIVVAAATAFSFFVAAYQKQLQSEEALAHDKALEDLRILNLVPTTVSSTDSTLSFLKVEIASSDVNVITIDGLTVNGNAVVNFAITNVSGTVWPYGCFNAALTASNTSCTLVLPAEAQVDLSLNLNPSDTSPNPSPPTPAYAFTAGTSATFSEGSLLAFQVFTSLGNEFTQSFVPPVAIAGVTFVDSYPILDGTSSYQPSTNTSESVTIDLWNWEVTTVPALETVNQVTAGSNSESGILYFSIPSAYSPTMEQALSDLQFGGSASADAVAGTVSITSNNVTDTTDVVSFTYTVSVDSSGTLFVTGGTLSDTDLPDGGQASFLPNDTGTFSGQEVELEHQPSPGVDYSILLFVTNSESLVGSTEIQYTAD